MPRDILYLLKPDFRDGPDGPYFCPDSAFLEGVLSFYPMLQAKLDIQYLEYATSQATVASQLDGQLDVCPLLVLADPDALPDAPRANGVAYLDDTRAICRYLARRYGIGEMH